MIAAMQCRDECDCLIGSSAFEISTFEIIFDGASLLWKVVFLIIPGWGEGYTFEVDLKCKWRGRNLSASPQRSP